MPGPGLGDGAAVMRPTRSESPALRIPPGNASREPIRKSMLPVTPSRIRDFMNRIVLQPGGTPSMFWSSRLYLTSRAASSGEDLTLKGDSCQEIPDGLKDRICTRGVLLAPIRDRSLPLTEANANLAEIIERS